LPATAIALALLGPVFAAPAAAQWQKPGEPRVYGPGEIERNESEFRLFGARDQADAGLRFAGDFSGCTRNAGNLTRSQCWNNFHPSRLFMPDWFDLFFYFAAPPSEWNKHTAAVESLANARGKGYTVNSPFGQFRGEILPHDGSLGPFHSGVTDQGDGSCLDYKEIGSGNPLLAAGDCEPTWGSLGWQGSRPVSARGFLEYADRVGDANFSFDPWQVPEELHNNDSFLGDFQVFGFFSDYSSEALFGSGANASYGNVIPQSMGGDPDQEPQRTGWPLGLLAKMDVFSFTGFGLKNTGWYQITITNNSREVFGVGLDYDSLYVGLQAGLITFNTGTSLYRDPANGVTRGATMCQGFTNSSSQGTSGNGCGPGGDPMHPAASYGSAPPSGVGAGFNYGAAAIVVLKSPIGDLRNKLLTDPESRFFGKGDPRIWDDTITFNHGHMCGFHGCEAVIWAAAASTAPNTDYEQRQFGMVASVTSDVLGNRAVSDPSNHTTWDTFRWEEYPDRDQLDFNRWTPGRWDYDDDGIDDVLSYEDCTDNAGPQYDPFTGLEKQCSVSWSDTLPGGFGNVYSSASSVTGAGPFSLPADSMAQWLMAIVMASDLASIENDIGRAVEHYMTFYGLVERAPAPGITSVEIESGGEGFSKPTEPEARATFYLDATTEDWEDPFLQNFLDQMLASEPGTELNKLRLLNPFLEDTVRALITNNVSAIHVFKSCEAGLTFTADDDCLTDPVELGPFAEIGWIPWTTLEPGATGDFPNVFADDGIVTGRSYLYSLVTQTRGLEVPVLVGEPDSVVVITDGDTLVSCVRNCRTEILTIQEPTFSKLVTVTTKPWVVSLYVPASRQSGSVGATVELVTPSPDWIPLERMNVRATDERVDDGEYSLLFGDSVTVTELATISATGDADVTRSIVDVTDPSGGTQTFEAPGAVGVEGEFSETIVGDQRTRVYAFDELTAVLANAGGVPLTVTASLAGGQTVPGRYFGLPNFPGFSFSIDNELAGRFNEQSYLDANGERILPLVEPSLTYLPGQTSGVNTEGRYRIVWSDAAFGAGSPFELDLADPQNTRATVVSSLIGREAGSIASRDPAIADWLGLPHESMLEVRLPFEIWNVTDAADPRPVTVVITEENKLTHLLLGSGQDTMIVDVPNTEWLPGDGMMFIEGTAPDFELAIISAVLGCEPVVWSRVECNPVTLSSPGATGYIPNGPGQQLFFSYYQTITTETEYTFSVQSALAGKELLTTDPDAVRAALDSVKVVPNPFVLYSRYSITQDENYILFTHVPPHGLIRIYTPAGQYINLLRWDPRDLNGQGDLRFNLKTREDLELAAGLYLYILYAKDEAGNDIGVKKGKFVVIR
jgi:hypothetical protein